MKNTTSERTIILLVAAVQFINILDFVMVMPLGPYFAHDLGMPTSELGSVGAAYTAAAAIAGLIGSAVLDRFDRRTALGVTILGLVAGTAAGGFALGAHSLLAARLLAGFFGGPATSVAIAIVADIIPEHRRGRAMSTVMISFSVAQILGVPASLMIAQHIGWRSSFFIVAGLGVILASGAVFLLPNLRGHLALRGERKDGGYRALLSQPTVQLSYAMTALTMASGFLIVPNIAGYVTGNLGFPLSQLQWLYAIGGVTSVFTIPFVGRLIDRLGSFRVGTMGVVMVATVLLAVFYDPDARFLGVSVTSAITGNKWWMAPIFIAFMTAMAFRNVAYNTLTTKVPQPQQRARFNSLQSSVQHLASASGAYLSSKLLTSAAVVPFTGQSETITVAPLIGMSRVVVASLALAAGLPVLLWIVERRVLQRPVTTPPPDAVPAD
jgi:predicted MFS family arabinose efflux permease